MHREFITQRQMSLHASCMEWERMIASGCSVPVHAQPELQECKAQLSDQTLASAVRAIQIHTAHWARMSLLVTDKTTYLQFDLPVPNLQTQIILPAMATTYLPLQQAGKPVTVVSKSECSLPPSSCPDFPQSSGVLAEGAVSCAGRECLSACLAAGPIELAGLRLRLSLSHGQCYGLAVASAGESLGRSVVSISGQPGADTSSMYWATQATSSQAHTPRTSSTRLPPPGPPMVAVAGE